MFQLKDYPNQIKHLRNLHFFMSLYIQNLEEMNKQTHFVVQIIQQNDGLNAQSFNHKENAHESYSYGLLHSNFDVVCFLFSVLLAQYVDAVCGSNLSQKKLLNTYSLHPLSALSL